MSQTAIHTHLRMPDITSSMKEDKKGPKNLEITLGLGYSKNTVSKIRIRVPTEIQNQNSMIIP